MKKFRESLIRNWKLHLLSALLTALIFTYKKILEEGVHGPLANAVNYCEDLEENKE